MRQPKVTEMLDGRMYIFDDAFEPPELNELVVMYKTGHTYMVKLMTVIYRQQE